MNLHGIVSGAISAINPFVFATVQVSTGYTTNQDGSRVPTYSTIVVSAQVQALQYNDIVQLDGLNIQGVRRKIYLTGDIESLIRISNKGGDILTMPDGTVWKVVLVFEHWDSWVAVAVTLQDGA